MITYQSGVIFTIICTLLLTGLLSLVILTWVSYAQKLFVQSESMDLMTKEHENALMAAKLEIQELTFQVIAKEIHGHITNALLISKMNLDSVDFNDIHNAKIKVSTSSELIDESINALRMITKTLNSDTIKNLGLIAAIRQLVDKMNISGQFTITTQVTGDIKRLKNDTELLAFRIVQEALNNVIKHSQAKDIDISLAYFDTHLDLVIKDNGIGFSYLTNSSMTNGEGLNNIKIRTQALKGEVTIVSMPNKGTSICITIPYN